MTTRVAAITGATGYLGTVLESAFIGAGYSVRRLVRTPRPATDDRAFTLGPDVDPSGLEGVDVLVHCAYDMKLTRRSDIWERNVFGTIRLLDAARAVGVRRTIAVSSMSAYPGTRQLYGRAKLETELAALGRNQVVLRPGLVYGPGWGGMAGTLRKLSATSRPAGLRGPDTSVHRARGRPGGGIRCQWRQSDRRPKVPGRDRLSRVRSVPVVARRPGHRSGETATSLRPYARRRRTGRPAIGRTPRRPLPVRADSLLGLLRPAPFVANVGVLTDLGVRSPTLRRVSRQAATPRGEAAAVTWTRRPTDR